jgi:hypothetical protein
MLKFLIVSLGSVSTLATFGFAGTAAMSSTQGEIVLTVLISLVVLLALLQWAWSLRPPRTQPEPIPTPNVVEIDNRRLPCKTAQ